jgi:hypothetical protein
MKPTALKLTAAALAAALSMPAMAEIITVDVLGLYTKDLTDAGKDGPTRLAAMVEFANQALENSQVDMRYRLVHTQQVDLVNDGNTDGDALDAVTNDSGVAALRDQYGADMVSMITNTGPYCGIAWVGQGDSNGTFRSYAKNYAYSVTGYTCVSSFAHELGHNLSLGHSRKQGSTGNLYEHGVGYGVDNTFVTLMAYESAFSTYNEQQLHSNPDLSTCVDLPCGVPHDQAGSSDASFSLRAAAPQAATWRPTVVDGGGSKPGTATELATNGNFDNLDGWSVFPSDSWGTLSQTEDLVDSVAAAAVSGRRSSVAGPFQTLDVANIEAGTTYNFTAWAKLGEGTYSRQRAYAYLYTKDANNRGRWHRLARTSIVQNEWTKLQGSFTAGDIALSSAKLLIWGPSRRNDFLVDEVSFSSAASTPTTPTNLVANADFESNADGWNGKYGAQLATVADGYGDSMQSLSMTNRRRWYSGASYDLTGSLENGKTYSISAKVKTAEENQRGRIYLLIRANNRYRWYFVKRQDVGTNWSELSGEKTINVSGDIQSAQVVFMVGNSGVDSQMDDVVVQVVE